MPLKKLPMRLKPANMAAVQRTADSWRTGKKTAERGYGYSWQKARESFLRSNPLCIYCQREGRVTVATVVDHIIPHQGDQSKFWDIGNWAALCAHCHSSTKQREELRSKSYK